MFVLNTALWGWLAILLCVCFTGPSAPDLIRQRKELLALQRNRFGHPDLSATFAPPRVEFHPVPRRSEEKTRIAVEDEKSSNVKVSLEMIIFFVWISINLFPCLASGRGS